MAIDRVGIPRSGFSWISIALAVYAASATSEAISAGFIVTAPFGEPFGDNPIVTAAFFFLFVGGALALASLVFALLGFRSFGRSKVRVDANVASTLSLSWGVFWLGCVMAVVGAFLAALVTGFPLPLFPPDARRAYDFFYLGLLVVVTVTAVLLLAGVALPPVRLNMGRDRALAWLALFLGIVAISGNAFVSSLYVAYEFNGYSSYPPPSLLTFGGWPLLNINVPFGTLVAVSAALFAWSYRKLSTRFAGSTSGIASASQPDPDISL